MLRIFVKLVYLKEQTLQNAEQLGRPMSIVSAIEGKENGFKLNAG